MTDVVLAEQRFIDDRWRRRAYTLPMSSLGALSQAWVTAEAALPLGWRIVGRLRRERALRLLPALSDVARPEWCALAEDERARRELDGLPPAVLRFHASWAVLRAHRDTFASYGPALQSGAMSRPAASEPVCLRCELAEPAALHAVEVKNTRFWFRARLCQTCYDELMRRRRSWLARPQAEPGSLKVWRLEHGLSVRELARRIGVSASMVSAVERGKVKAWRGYLERARQRASG